MAASPSQKLFILIENIYPNLFTPLCNDTQYSSYSKNYLLQIGYIVLRIVILDKRFT